MLLETSLHAVDGASTNFQAAVDGCRVDAGFEKLDDLLLHRVALFAAAGHGDDGWRFGAVDRFVGGVFRPTA